MASQRDKPKSRGTSSSNLTHVSDIVFETERLFARPWSIDDAEGAFVMYGDPEMVRHIGNNLVPDLDVQREQLKTIIERYRRWNGRFGSWPLFDKQSRELVG